MDRALLSALNRERAARRAVALVTELETGRGRLVREEEASGDPLAEPVVRVLRTGKSETAENGSVFLAAYLPPPRLVVIGAVHISQALAPMARLAGFALDIVDPRTAFASPERFPGVMLHPEWPEDWLRKQPLDPYTAMAALTHDPKIDDVPLREALRAGCFYVGALGSRKTHARRTERLVAAGIGSEQVSRIDAPIGMDIGAATPPEIAVAVLAAVIAAFRQRDMSRGGKSAA